MNITRQDMKKTLLWAVIWALALTTAFLMPTGIHAQTVNCNSIVSLDQANVFPNTSAIDRAASGLIDQGADVHVVSASMAEMSSLKSVQSKLESSCPSWTIAGHRKPNLFVLIVAPAQKKKNAFFGAAYTPVMPTEDSVNVIYSQAANPYFKQGDFSGGVAAALKDFGAKVVAYHDQQKHPVETHVTEQATDLSGLWTVLGWIVGLGAFAGLVVFLFVLMSRRSKAKEELSIARANARLAKSRATHSYQSISPDSPRYSRLSERFLELSNSIKYDPDTDGQTLDDYASMQASWQALYDDCNPFLVGSRASTPGHSKWRKVKSQVPTSAPYATAPSAPSSAGNTYQAAPSTVVVHDNSGSDLLTGMLVGEALSQPRERDVYVHDAPSYIAPEPSYDYSSGSGSDSSCSSSDDSSSSGSDSSYDSGSSDSGGSGDDSSW
jgi:uncharacterized membrane protein YgcG